MNSQEVIKTHKREKHIIAAVLLYAVSVLGILNLFTTAPFTGVYTKLMSLDIGAYVLLAAIAYFIYRGSNIAKIGYAILAILWYITLIFFLPERFGHTIDTYVIFMQVILTVLAYWLLFITTKHTQ